MEGERKERCPGEDECRLLPSFPLNRRADPLIECPQCERRHSKPGFVDAEVIEVSGLDSATIQRHAANALDLDVIQRTGWAGRYPVELSVWDWVGLRALTSARAQDERAAAKTDQAAAPGFEYSSGGQAQRLRAQMQR